MPGHIVNCPLPPGSGSEVFRKAVSEHWLPALEAFAPQMVFISAGFDAHAADDLAELRLPTADYAWVTELASASRTATRRTGSSRRSRAATTLRRSRPAPWRTSTG